MKGKITFILVSVILAVTIGYSSDISAYTAAPRYEDSITDSTHELVSSPVISTAMSQSLNSQDLNEAVSEAENVSGSTQNQKPEALGFHVTDSAAQIASESMKAPFSNAGSEQESMQMDLSGTVSKGIEEEERQAQAEAYQNEVEVLERIVMAEAGGEDLQGQIMVANVVLNRVKAGFGSTITEVVFSPGQFEPVQTGGYWCVTPSDSVIEACRRALAGEDYSSGALYFCSIYGDTSYFDSNLTFVTEHGGHRFYR